MQDTYNTPRTKRHKHSHKEEANALNITSLIHTPEACMATLHNAATLLSRILLVMTLHTSCCTQDSADNSQAEACPC